MVEHAIHGHGEAGTVPRLPRTVPSAASIMMEPPRMHTESHRRCTPRTRREDSHIAPTTAAPSAEVAAHSALYLSPPHHSTTEPQNHAAGGGGV